MPYIMHIVVEFFSFVYAPYALLLLNYFIIV